MGGDYYILPHEGEGSGCGLYTASLTVIVYASHNVLSPSGVKGDRYILGLN